MPLVVDAEAGVLVYRELPGTQLLDVRFGDIDIEPELRRVDDAALAGPLAELLTVLHNAPVAEFGVLAGVDDESTGVWLAEAVESYRSISSFLTPAQRRAVESFLDSEPPAMAGPLVFSHNDLGAEHLLVDTETGVLTGVIDWTDAAVTDRAQDFARLFLDLGPAVHDAVLSHYRGPYGAADFDRTVFYARCTLIEDAAYGIETDNPAYYRAAIAHFPHTFDA
ncbi:Bifunctional AAC/APH [Actinokineospora sp. UTMC 2448]|nr:Bifunctional AAC/APH [Actinokineospora sp. UTMC 2448]